MDVDRWQSTRNVRNYHDISLSFNSHVSRTDFSRRDYKGAPMTDLLDIIGYVKPTALLGLSTIKVSLNFVPLTRY